MNVFDLDRVLVSDYERFARSCTQIRAPDILGQVEAIYASGRFWPDPLISTNPHFERAESVQDLVEGNSLHTDTARVVSERSLPRRLHGGRLLGRGIRNGLRPGVARPPLDHAESVAGREPCLEAGIRRLDQLKLGLGAKLRRERQTPTWPT